jgi:hypothetical protein
MGGTRQKKYKGVHTPLLKNILHPDNLQIDQSLVSTTVIALIHVLQYVQGREHGV